MDPALELKLRRAIANGDASAELAVRREIARAGQLTHTTPGSAMPANTPPPNYSPEPLSPWQAFQTGRHRGNVEEIQAQLGGEVRPWPDGSLYWKPEGSDQWRPVNPKGPDWNDIPRMIGEQFGPTAGSAALAATAATVPGFLAKSAIGAFGGTMADQGLQYLEGTQRETLGEQATQAGLDALLYGGGAALGMGVGRTLPGGGPSTPSRHAGETLRSAVRFQEANPQFPAPLAADIMEETGMRLGPAAIPAPVARGAMRQVEGMTGALGGARRDLAAQAAQAVDDTFILPPGARGGVNARLAGAATRAVDRVKADTAAGGPNAEAGAYRVGTGTASGREAARGLVSDQYEGPLASAVAAEKPVFDLRGLKKEWAAPALDRTEVDPATLAATLREVEVIPDAQGRIAALKRVISTLDDEQTNFEALKRIRTVAADMAGDPAFRDFTKNPAARLRNELTEVLRNPKNAAQTPGYLKEFESANLLNQWKEGLINDSVVVRALKNDGSGMLVREAANNPEAIFSPKFRELMNLAPREDANMFRDAVRRTILDSTDPAGVLDKWKISTNPEPYYYLFGGKSGYQRFRAQAETVSRFYGTPVGKMYQERLKAYETTKYAVEQIKTPREAAEVWAALTTADEKEAFRSALIDNTVGQATDFTKQGILKVNDVALRNRIHDLQKTGRWGLLTPDQQKRLSGFADYVQVVLSKTGDTGAMLENASVTAKLKNIWHVWDPIAVKRGVDALQSLGTNAILGRYVTNPKRAQRLMNSLDKAPRDLKKWGMATIFAIPPITEAADAGVVDPAKELARSLGFYQSGGNEEPRTP